MSSSTNSFPKSEHLCGEIRINKLFAEGKAFIVYPLRVVYSVKDDNDTLEPFSKIMFSVPKKRFKRAVKRNRLKRLMRESYRLNKSVFVSVLKDRHLTVEIAVAYLSDEMIDFELMQQKMKLVLQKIISKLSEVKPIQE